VPRPARPFAQSRASDAGGSMRSAPARRLGIPSRRGRGGRSHANSTREPGEDTPAAAPHPSSAPIPGTGPPGCRSPLAVPPAAGAALCPPGSSREPPPVPVGLPPSNGRAAGRSAPSMSSPPAAFPDLDARVSGPSVCSFPNLYSCRFRAFWACQAPCLLSSKLLLHYRRCSVNVKRQFQEILPKNENSGLTPVW